MIQHIKKSTQSAAIQQTCEAALLSSRYRTHLDCLAFAPADWHLPNGPVLQSTQQAVLRRGRELQICASVSSEPAGRAGQIQGMAQFT